jgi:molybdopterin-guanine dinucleotide biosynthesis protein A
MDVAGIVLAGGRSSRMGTAKAGLEWHRSTLLYRTCGVLQRALAGPVVVVAAPGQELPRLPHGVRLVADPVEGRGPVQGLATGLSALAEGGYEAAYVSATDMPFLHPAFVRRVVAELNAVADVVLPHVGGIAQPLAAVYRTAIAKTAQDLVDHNRLRFQPLLVRCAKRRIEEPALLADDDLLAADPELESVLSIDDFDAYQRARSRPGPRVTIERVGALAREVDQGARPVRAATLALAATAAGVELGPAIAVTLCGESVEGDPELPLVDGDQVTFAAAAAA